MLTDINFSKAQISKLIKPDRSFGSWLATLGKKSTNKCCDFFNQR